MENKKKSDKDLFLSFDARHSRVNLDTIIIHENSDSARTHTHHASSFFSKKKQTCKTIGPVKLESIL